MVGRNAEMRAKLVGNGAADFVAGNLTDHIKPPIEQNTLLIIPVTR
jgi:hypothetical protein